MAQYTTDRLNATTETGETFGAALCSVLSAVPSQITVTQISINQNNQPWSRISYLDGNVIEFDTDNRPQGIRTDVTVAGATIAMLCLKLQKPTTSGWTDRCDNSDSGIADA